MSETAEQPQNNEATQDARQRVVALDETAHRVAYHIVSSHTLVGASISFIILVAAKMIYLGIEAAASRDKEAARGMVDHLSDNLIALADEFGLTSDADQDGQ